jgi:hypothetical protein
MGYLLGFTIRSTVAGKTPFSMEVSSRENQVMVDI